MVVVEDEGLHFAKLDFQQKGKKWGEGSSLFGARPQFCDDLLASQRPDPLLKALEQVRKPEESSGLLLQAGLDRIHLYMYKKNLVLNLASQIGCTF